MSRVEGRWLRIPSAKRFPRERLKARFWCAFCVRKRDRGKGRKIAMATPTTLPADWAEQNLPIFRVYADQGSHPPVALNRPVCVIGGDYDANFALEGPQVSRLDVLFVRSPAAVYHRHLASTNA